MGTEAAGESKEGGETMGQAVGEGARGGAMLVSIRDVLASTYDEAYRDGGITGC
jgi:hypothetical protein